MSTASIDPPAAPSEDKKAEPQVSALYRARRYLHVLPFLPAGSTFIYGLALLAALHSIALLLFTRGFLLTRQALPDINDCDPISASGNLDASCSLPPTHDKLIFLVVDALRADFVLPVDPSEANPHYQNHLPLPSYLTQQHPTHSFLSHFIADAPTTTLQRLKGMTTGSLPTFIDAGSNFAGERVDEDNWLWQAKRAGKRIALVGDETWLNVFPRGGDKSVWKEDLVWPYSSFEVEDLDTVDRGVEQHLLELLEPTKQGEWDVVVAHGLGLDHAGHRFGAEHAETKRKLEQTNRLLEQVVEKMAGDTLLVVVGDHGMTDRGDHGGDSREEVDAALWVYSKAAKPLIEASWFDQALGSPKHPLHALHIASASAHELGDRLELAWPEKHLPTFSRAVSQIDLVPTLSLLLGLPVPFGNLGLSIPELFYHASELPVAPTPPTAEGAQVKAKRGFLAALQPKHDQPKERALETLKPFQTFLQATLLTASQLEHYLLTYTSRPSGKDLLPSMPELSFLLSLGKSAYTGAHAPGHVRTEMEQRAVEKFWTYERKARDKARVVWARFDPRLMGAGLGIWAGSLFVAARLASAAKRGPTARFLVGRAVEGSFLALLAVVGLQAGGAFKAFGGLKPLIVLSAAAAGAELAVILAPASPTVAQAFGLRRILSLRQFAPLFPLLAHAASFASNSMTVFEDSVVLYLLTSLLVLTLVSGLAAPEARLRNRIVGFTAVALVSVRLMAYSTICREEQVPQCSPTFYLAPTSLASQVVLAASALAALAVPTAFRSSLALSSSDEALAPLYLGVFVRALLLSGTTYWVLDWMLSALSLSPTTAMLAAYGKTGIARVVLVCSALTATLVWRFSPLCIRIQREQLQDATGRPLRTQIKVLGFANALGSSYLLFFAAIFSLLFLVSPPQAQIVLSLHVVVLLCLLEIWDSERDVEHIKTALTSITSLEAFLADNGDGTSGESGGLPPAPPHTGPTFVQISTLALLAHLSFFATGHQAVLSSIQWSTAFIGFPSVTYPFSPLLVTLNTLASFILTGAALPLFVFWNLAPTLPNQGGPPLVVGRHLLRAGASYTGYIAAVGLASAACAAWLRRHLMVWKVFAPRFMLGGVVILATEVTVVLVAMAWGARGVLSKTKSSLGTKVAE
ncbi:hypothetical protein JCM8097_007587 [Rhodosporidiobolus ruineniae]